MSNKARHVYGALSNVDSALSTATIDAYDILFVKDDKGNPVIGWIDPTGQKSIVDTNKVVKVDTENLPESGEEDKIYLYKDEGYFWNGTEFKPLAKSTDISELETKIDEKVDEARVLELIEQSSDSAIEIIEI